ncbi:MAG: nucleotide exchange factor GrpE [Actinomycetota bacterium]|nr:nucleotide exchange factor GrpE [Actinomycetota bacterium]
MEQPRKVPVKVQVKDKRRVGRDDAKQAGNEPADQAAGPADAVESEVVEAELLEAPEDQTADEQQPDYLGDLQRLQAEFANYRKRMMAQNAESAARGEARLVEKLLPVLDNFELAIAHGEGGTGVEMVFKELRSVLEGAGLTEVPGEGAPFDYHVHQAVESHEDDSVATETVRTVHRRGYTMNGTLLRPAMVGVAKPPPPAPDEAPTEEAPEE